MIAAEDVSSGDDVAEDKSSEEEVAEDKSSGDDAAEGGESSGGVLATTTSDQVDNLIDRVIGQIGAGKIVTLGNVSEGLGLRWGGGGEGVRCLAHCG